MARRADDIAPLLAGMLVRVDVQVHTPEEVREYGRAKFSFINAVLKSGRTVSEN